MSAGVMAGTGTRPLAPPAGAALPAPLPASPQSSSLSFGVFLLVHASLFLRPGEVIPDLRGVNLMLAFAVLNVIVALPDVLRQFSSKALEQRPMTLCLLGLLVAVGMSHLVHFRIDEALERSFDMLKCVVYYLLLVSVVDSPRRVRSFVGWTLVFTAVMATIAIMDYHGVIRLEKLDRKNALFYGTMAAYKEGPIERMEGSGLFQDPNEICAMLAASAVLCLGLLTDRRAGSARYLWVVPLGLFLYGVAATQSRGGLLALLVGLGAVCQARLGWSRTLMLGMCALPLVPLLVGGRQADLSTKADTATERIELWSNALMFFRTSPLFGIGLGEMERIGGLVAHNSYLHAFAELGLFGGMMLLGVVYLPLSALYRLRPDRYLILDPELSHLRPYVLGCLASYAMAMLSLTVFDIMPPYAILGLGTAFLAVTVTQPARPAEKVDLSLMVRLLIASTVFLLCMQVFVRVSRG